MFHTHASFLLIHSTFAKKFSQRNQIPRKLLQNICSLKALPFKNGIYVCMSLHKFSHKWLSFVTCTGYKTHWILPLLAEVQKKAFLLDLWHKCSFCHSTGIKSQDRCDTTSHKKKAKNSLEGRSTLILLSPSIQEHPAENLAFYNVPKLYVQQGYNMHLLISQ